MFSETVLSEGIAIVKEVWSDADSSMTSMMTTLQNRSKTPGRILLSALTLSFALLLHSGFAAHGQSTDEANSFAAKDQSGKSQVPGLAAAKIPQGLDFPNFSEKIYGDTEFELGGEFDKSGLLMSIARTIPRYSKSLEIKR